MRHTTETDVTTFLSIKFNKNNIFLCLSKSTGNLITYKSVKNKKFKDLKLNLTWALTNLVQKIKILKLKYLTLIFNNANIDLIQHVFSILKLWDVNVCFLKYIIPVPHNGCRKTKIPRKRNKGKKKNKNFELGL